MRDSVTHTELEDDWIMNKTQFLSCARRRAGGQLVGALESQTEPMRHSLERRGDDLERNSDVPWTYVSIAWR